MVWYNPIDDVKSLAHGVQDVFQSDLVNQIWDSTKNTAIKVGGDTKRAFQSASDDLHFGNIWEAATDIGRGAGNVTHDLIGLGTGKVPTCAWDNGQVLEATLNKQGEGSKQFKVGLDVLNTLWDDSSNPPGYGGVTRSASKYYDDNAWIGIALMDAHKQNPNNAFYMDRAKQIFDLEEFGTKGTDQLPHPGGVFWSQEPGNNYRSTVSTAGAAQLALSLYGETSDQKYLDFAKKQFDWVNDTLKDEKTGLYKDGIGGPNNPTDKITPDQWSYNQGLMLGDATMLYKATGDTHYLEQAQQIAKNSLTAFGPNGDQRDFNEQPAFFNAVFFKNLMLLDSVSPDSSYRNALSEYSGGLKEQIKNVAVRDPSPLNVEASAAQVFALAEKYPPDQTFN